MRALILAAGRGSRMGERTADRPKCLTEVAGRPLLAWQIAALRAGGCERIAVIRGYRGDMLDRFDLDVFENSRWAKTNMVTSLACARAWLAEHECIVSYADIFYPAETVRRLATTPAEIAIAYDRDWLALWRARFADPLADAESFRLDPQGHVEDIGRRATTLDEIQGQYMGLLRITPRGWESIEAVLDAMDMAHRDRLDMTSLLRMLVGFGQKIRAVPTAPGWGEVDSPSDAELYEREIGAGRLALGA
jgi:choline kinase